MKNIDLIVLVILTSCWCFSLYQITYGVGLDSKKKTGNLFVFFTFISAIFVLFTLCTVIDNKKREFETTLKKNKNNH